MAPRSMPAQASEFNPKRDSRTRDIEALFDFADPRDARRKLAACAARVAVRDRRARARGVRSRRQSIMTGTARDEADDDERNDSHTSP